MTKIGLAGFAIVYSVFCGALTFALVLINGGSIWVPIGATVSCLVGVLLAFFAK